MLPASRTPEGEPNHCPICGAEFCLDPSRPPGDAPCPDCGSLVWYSGPTTWGMPPSATECVALVRDAHQRPDEDDVDFEIRLLRDLRARVPDSLVYRRALWDAQKRARRDRRKRRRIAIAMNRYRLRRAKRKHDWPKVQAAADDCLDLEPFNAALHLDLADAFREQGLRELAIFALTCAGELLPNRDDRLEFARRIKKLAKS